MIKSIYFTQSRFLTESPPLSAHLTFYSLFLSLFFFKLISFSFNSICNSIKGIALRRSIDRLSDREKLINIRFIIR